MSSGDEMRISTTLKGHFEKALTIPCSLHGNSCERKLQVLVRTLKEKCLRYLIELRQARILTNASLSTEDTR